MSPTSKDLDPLSAEMGAAFQRSWSIRTAKFLGTVFLCVGNATRLAMAWLGRAGAANATLLPWSPRHSSIFCLSFALSISLIYVSTCSGCVPARDPASGCRRRSNQSRSSLASVRTWRCEEISEPSPVVSTKNVSHKPPTTNRGASWECLRWPLA